MTTERRLRETQRELAEARRTHAAELAKARRREASWAAAARQIERSRTWRLGSFLVRALRVLTLRRPLRSEGPAELAARIEAAATAKTGGSQAPREPSLRRQLQRALDRAWEATREGNWDEAVGRWRAVIERFGDDAPRAASVELTRALLNTGQQEAADAIVARRAARRVDDYQEWIDANDRLARADRDAIRARIASMPEPPTFSVLMPVHDPRPAHLRRALESVLGQLYPHWELCIVDDASSETEVREVLEAYAGGEGRIKVRFGTAREGIAGATNTALELATCDWITLLDHDDILAERALYLIAEAIAANREAALLYSDSDHLDEGGRRVNPYFKPDWDPDLFLGQNYIAHLGVYRADLARAAGGWRAGYEDSQGWDFALRVIEAAGGDPVVHVPHVLYHRRISRSSFSQANLQAAADSGHRAVSGHLERSGLDAVVEPGGAPTWHRIRWTVPSPPPLVSAVVPTRDRHELLRRCVEGIAERTEYPAIEIVIVDNDSRDTEAVAYLESIGERDDVLVVRDTGVFNYSRLCNRGVAASRGEVIVLLNNDIEVTETGWLRELVSHAIRPEVGAVGAKLYFENRSIQHAGVILGMGKNDVGGHAFRFLPRISEPRVPFGRTRLTRNYSAVTGACMALRREVYEKVDGLNEVNLPVQYNDVDLCLRIRAAGYRVIWTPFAELYHHEKASRASAGAREKMVWHPRAEVDYMHEGWGHLLRADPFFNPNLCLSSEDFSFATPTRAPKPWRDSATQGEEAKVNPDA